MRNILWRYQSKDWKWPWFVGFERFEQCRPLWPLWDICYTCWLPKFGHQTLNCLSIRYIVPAKISPAFQLCQKNWFCGKVCLNDFYPLLRSKSSSWIHIGVKRISQACSLHHQKNMGKTCETQLWDEKQNRALFLDHPAVAISFSGNHHKLGNGKKIGASICSPSSVGISLTVTARRIFF